MRIVPFLGAAIATLALTSCDTAPSPQPFQPDRNATRFYERPAMLAAVRRQSPPAPLIVLLTRNPWLTVIGSDAPTFALYEDGTVIYRSGETFMTARLPSERVRRVVQTFATSSLPRRGGLYGDTSMTDLPNNLLLLYLGKQPICIDVYGMLDDPALRARLPISVVNAFDRLRTFEAPGAKVWLPAKVELMLWGGKPAVQRSAAWPDGWPGIHDPTTLHRHTSSYSIYLPAADLLRLERMLAREKEQPLRIDGRNWATGVRYPFPNERLWMRAVQ